MIQKKHIDENLPCFFHSPKEKLVFLYQILILTLPIAISSGFSPNEGIKKEHKKQKMIKDILSFIIFSILLIFLFEFMKNLLF